jgi:hypothetical protein
MIFDNVSPSIKMMLSLVAASLLSSGPRMTQLHKYFPLEKPFRVEL